MKTNIKKLSCLIIAAALSLAALQAQTDFNTFYERGLLVLGLQNTSLRQSGFESTSAKRNYPLEIYVGGNLYGRSQWGKSLELNMPFINDLTSLLLGTKNPLGGFYFTEYIHFAGGLNVWANDKNVLAIGVNFGAMGRSLQTKEDPIRLAKYIVPGKEMTQYNDTKAIGGSYVRYDRLLGDFLLRAKSQISTGVYYGSGVRPFVTMTAIETMHKSGFMLGFEFWKDFSHTGVSSSRLDLRLSYSFKYPNR
jgi:hypothetical protein